MYMMNWTLTTFDNTVMHAIEIVSSLVVPLSIAKATFFLCCGEIIISVYFVIYKPEALMEAPSLQYAPSMSRKISFYLRIQINLYTIYTIA